MKPPNLKRIAHWAKHDLASKNQTLGTGHIHELTAAMFGFNSHAAFLQSDALEQLLPAYPTIAVLDSERAVQRCNAIVPNVDATLVVKRLEEMLDKESSPELLFLKLTHEANAPAQMARQWVLRHPRMKGVVDNLEARIRGAVANGFQDNDMLRSIYKHAGPVNLSSVSTDYVQGTIRIQGSGEYEDAAGKGGRVQLEAHFKPLWPRIYRTDHLDVEFFPGEFEELIVDHFADFEGSPM